MLENERKSTSKAICVPIKLEKHPNADSLSTCSIFDGGYSCVLRTEDWKNISKGIWIPPDSVASISKPEFAFLAPEAKSDGKVRIKAKKLRGIVSFGLMIPAPENAEIGQDFWVELGLERYEPDIEREKNGNAKLFGGNDIAKSPNTYHIQYDLEAGRNYKNVFIEGEPVVVSEKINGENSRYTFEDGQMYCSSHYYWKKEFASKDHITLEKLIENGVEEEKAKTIIDRIKNEPVQRNKWWVALDKTKGLRELCEQNPGIVVYGELVGTNGKMKYGYKNGEFSIMVFDIMKNGKFMDFEDAYALATKYGVNWVPIVERNIPYNFEKICKLAEGNTLVPNGSHIREGVVIRPLKERYEHRVGRVCFKFVSAAYFEMK